MQPPGTLSNVHAKNLSHHVLRLFYLPQRLLHGLLPSEVSSSSSVAGLGLEHGTLASHRSQSSLVTIRPSAACWTKWQSTASAMPEIPTV